MKIKNLAFFGIMASILSVGGAHAETQTVIASQAYVDAKDTATLTSAQNYANTQDATTLASAKSYTDGEIQKLDGTVTNDAAATDKAVTVISQANGIITAKTGQLTSAAISDKVTDFDEYNPTNDSAKLATAGAIEAAISEANSDLTALTARVTTNEGNIETNTNNISQNTADITTLQGNASTTGSVLNSIKLNSANGDYSGTLHTANNGVDTLQQAIDVNATAIAGKEDTSNKVTSVTSASTDTEYPSAKAVYAVSAAAATDTAPSATWNDTSKTLTYATSGAAGNTTKLATSAQVSTTVKALEASVNNTMVSKADATVATGKTYVQDTYTVKGNLEALDGALDGIVKTAFQSVDSTGTGEAVTVVAEDTTDGTKVNVTKSLLTYNGAMNSALGEINGQQGFIAGTNCTASNPCILSYTGSDYKWTQMVFPTTPTTTE